MWIRKMRVNALDHYDKRKWLDFMAHKWKAADRKRAGETWFKDFHEMGGNVKTIDPSKPRVDCQGFRQPSDERSRAEVDFYKASRVIPKDFHETVWNVCIENKVFKGSQSETFAVKKDLIRGLDYLCDFYAGRKREKI